MVIKPIINSIINPVIRPILGLGVEADSNLRPPAGFVFMVVNGKPIQSGGKYILVRI